LTTLLVLLILLGLVLPDPVRAGNVTGNAVDSMVVFFRALGNEVGGTVTTSESSGDGSGGAPRYPDGGVATGDGTYRTGPATLAAVQASVVPATPGDASADAVMDGVLPYSRPVQLHIPEIGVSTGLVRLGLEPDGTMEVPKTARTAGWYRGAPTPGERGPAVVTAHVDWLQEKGVFHDLGRMRPGDAVTVDRADGVALMFRVTRTEQYSKSRFPSQEVYGDTDGAELRLITCAGRFDNAARSYLDNLEVYARLVGVG
jgi:LPXTG-site transpeptidase (sortase) family protein